MLKIEALSKNFKTNINVLNNLNFDIPENKFVVLVGPSGSGKSTLLRVIAGLESATNGRIFIDNQDVTKLEPKKRNLGMVFQNYALYPHFTVRENLSYPLKIKKLSKSEISSTVSSTAQMLEITDILDSYPKQVSGGQKQRVAIGRCIVRNLDIFLFDEPLSNLDARLRESLRREIANLQKKIGKTFLYVTHDQVEAMALGEVIIVLNKGEIQQIGSPKQIYQSPSNLFTAEFIGSPVINKFIGNTESDKFIIKDSNISLELPQRIENKDDIAYACIRPEHLKLKISNSGKLKAELMHVEYLGAKNLLEFKFNDSKLLLETDSIEINLDIQKIYYLDFEYSDILWFDISGIAR